MEDFDAQSSAQPLTTPDSESVDRLPEELRAALDIYRKDGSAASWTSLSQLWVRDIQVIDALKRIKPDFADPFPLPVDGVVEDDNDFFQWPILPDADDVLRAVLTVLRHD